MDAKRKGNGTGKSMLTGIATGWCAALMITLLGTLVLSWMILAGTIDWKRLSYGNMIVLLLASYFGAAAAAEKTNPNRMMACILAGVVYLITLAGITALFFDGEYETIAVAVAMIAGGSVAAFLVHSAEKRGRRRKSRKRRL